MNLFAPVSPIILGTKRSFYFQKRTISISRSEARTHMHVLGKTGSGKSYFLLGLYLSLIEAGMAVTLIDPHGTLAKSVLAHLVQGGYFADPSAYERLIYLDMPAAVDQKRYIPFNFLDQEYEPHAIGEFVTDAFKRAYPELAEGAATFTNVVKNSVTVLCENGLSLASLADLLTDTNYRNQLLTKVKDAQAVRFFKQRVDAWGRDQAANLNSTLNRIDDLTYTPFMRHAFGHKRNSLQFQDIINSGKSMIVNLALPEYPEASRLFGCFLTVGFQQAAMHRSRLDEDEVARLPSYHLIWDEFQLFVQREAASFTSILSETRKYKLFGVFSHQNWSQIDPKLQKSMENVGIEFSFNAGRTDAAQTARLIGSIDTTRAKHIVEDEGAQERTHPLYKSIEEQWEEQTYALQTLRRGHCVVTMPPVEHWWRRHPHKPQHHIKTRTLPELRWSEVKDKLAEVRQGYLQRYFEPVDAASPALGLELPELLPVIGRRPPEQGGMVFRRKQTA